MRHPILTDDAITTSGQLAGVPVLFLAFFESVNHTAESHGPQAAIGLYVEIFDLVTSLIERAARHDRDTVAMLSDAGISIPALIATAEHVGDCIMALLHSLH